MAGEFFNAEPPRKPTPDMDWWVKVMTIIILWPIPLPSLECVTFYLIFQQLYEIETRVSLATEQRAFLGDVSFLNLHCTVPDMGNLRQGWLCCSNEEFLMFVELTVWNIGLAKKCCFLFCHTIVWKNQNQLLGQPSKRDRVVSGQVQRTVSVWLCGWIHVSR